MATSVERALRRKNAGLGGIGGGRGVLEIGEERNMVAEEEVELELVDLLKV